MSKMNFFIIEEELLPKDCEIFPFNIYLFNSLSNQYNLFLNANTPLLDEQKHFLLQSIKKGAKLAVDHEQKFTLLKYLNLNEDDIPSLKKPKLHDFQKKRLEHLEKLKEKKEKNQDSYKNETIGEVFLNVIETNDFSKLYEIARDEILCFDVTKSSTVNIAINLTDKLLIEDSITNRIVVLCYFLAKNLKITDVNKLGSLICASFLHHIGFTQIDLNFLRIPRITLSDDFINTYYKHMGLAQHLIRKSKIELSADTLKIILDHHERASGKGYPNKKRVEHIDLSAQILGLCSHVIEFSEAYIDGKKNSLSRVISLLGNKTPSQGLDLDFSDHLINAFIHLLGQNQNILAKSA